MKPRFIVETAPSRKGPWTPSGASADKARSLYTYARELWGAERSERRWVRVSKEGSARAVSLFEGGTYKPIGEYGRFGWVKVRP